MDIKFSDNLFLATAELNKFKQSLGEKGWKIFAKNLVKQFGISKAKDTAQFLPIPKSGVSEYITIKPGIAFDSDMNIVILENAVDIHVPADQLTGDLKYWVIIRHKTTHLEEGTVNVTSEGALTGNGTDFLSVLRGQPDFPTKVHLESQVNTGNYEVVSVSSATSAIIAGAFTAEQNLKYSVVGTFTPGFIPSAENAQIYEYDSCEIEVVMAEDVDSLSMEAGKDFLLCSVSYANTYMHLEDYRIYYMLDNPYAMTTEGVKASVDKIVSMPTCSIVSLNDMGIMLELQFEHGFRVTGFDRYVVATGYRLDIQGGSHIFPNAASLNGQNHLFQGWYLLNKTTMAYSVIDDSSNNRLFISDLNPDSVSDTNIVIVPPFNEIEYQITVGNNVPSPTIPYVFKFSTDNIRNKCIIPIMWKERIAGADEVTVSLRYRIIGSENDKYPLTKFTNSNFTRYDNLTLPLSDSSFVVYISDIQPEEVQRNYS